MSTLKNLPFTASQLSSILDEIGNDGHSIYTPSELAKHIGLPENIFDPWSHIHNSDGSHKGTITADGSAVESMKGMYGLDFLQSAAMKLNVKSTDMMGRGSRARSITSALRDYLKTV